jgi:hypothetical protein
MKHRVMKIGLVLIPLLPVVGFLVLPLTRSRAREIKDQVSGGLTSQSQKAEVIFEGFRRSANQNDGEAFRKELSRVFSKEFTGDPRQVLTDLAPYLTHENKRIRFELAKACVWAGIHNDKVVEVLCAFVIDRNYAPVEKELPGHSGEKYREDFRKDAARLLVTYRIKGIADPLWDAYQQTADRIYLRYLSVFKDERVANEAVSLIALKKAKYIDLHKIFGTYRIQEAADPLEAVFKARQEIDSKANQSELAWSIYQITQRQEYYDYLIQRKFYLGNTLIEVPGVLGILNTTLREGSGPGLDHERRVAFLSLLSRDGGRKVVEDYLVEFFDEKIKSSLDATLIYTTAAHLDSERLNLAVQRYEEKFGSGLWLHYSKRRGWPINELIPSYNY